MEAASLKDAGLRRRLRLLLDHAHVSRIQTWPLWNTAS